MNDNIAEQFKKMAQMFSDAEKENEAFILLPTIEGYKVFKVSKESAQLVITSQILKDRGEEITCKHQFELISNKDRFPFHKCVKCGAIG